ncbi:MAG: DUF2147 domain-containing protein [Myxococcota bacterium]
MSWWRSIPSVFAVIAFMSSSAFAEIPRSPEGEWTTVDDSSGKAKSIVKISRAADGKLLGHIVKVLDEDAEPNAVCVKCKGELKNKPMQGLRIMWDLAPEGDGEWDDGSVLDPENGKTYDCKIKLLEGGKKLRVRGYIGWSLFGRSQVWLRRSSAQKSP